MSELIAVAGDLVFGKVGGELIPSQTKVYIEGKPAIVDGDIANPVVDQNNPAANPTGFSTKVFIGQKGVHRHLDTRQNGYLTRVVGTTKVFAG